MSDLPSYAVDFRGFPACPCLAEWLPAYEAELQRRGILTGELHIYQLIGTYSGSGGTHADGGAFDLLDLSGDQDLWVGRQMGADAYWTRPDNWDGAGGIRHNHGVLTGCPHNAPARYQIAAVAAGFNGLGAGGRGAPDDGPRPLSGRTWRQGIEWAQLQEDEMTPDQVKTLDQIAADAARAADAAEKATRQLDNQRERQRTQTTRLRERLDKAIAVGKATKAELEAMRADLDDVDDQG